MAVKKKIDPKDYEAAFLFNYFLRSCYGLDDEDSQEYFQERPFCMEEERISDDRHWERFSPRSQINNGNLQWKDQYYDLRRASPLPFSRSPFILPGQQYSKYAGGKNTRMREIEDCRREDISDKTVVLNGDRWNASIMIRNNMRKLMWQTGNRGWNERVLGGINNMERGPTVLKDEQTKKFREPCMNKNGSDSELYNFQETQDGSNKETPGFICAYCREKFIERTMLVEHLLEFHAKKQ